MSTAQKYEHFGEFPIIVKMADKRAKNINVTKQHITRILIIFSICSASSLYSIDSLKISSESFIFYII